MNVRDSKFHKVKSVEDKGKVIRIKFTDSQKDKEGNWKGCQWSGILVGKAKEAGLAEGDKFTIVSGQVFSDKVGDKWYTNVTIFEVEVTEKAVADESIGDFSDVENDDLIPF